MDDESVDLIYLDPPFNSNRAYNIIYEDDIQAQAFDDTWIWTPECDRILAKDGPGMDMLRAMVGGMGKIHMAAYLVMMTPRLAELHRILKNTGSIYLHCDPTASHYLKVIMDSIFETRNFRNEIVWRMGWVSGYKTQKKGWIRNHDTMLYYLKSKKATGKFNKEYLPYPKDYVRRDGKRPKGKGFPIEDTWNCSEGDILNSIMIMSFSKEKLYPTQKPIKLLDRIVRASSNPGDIILDPFCGCGTTVHAAENLNRNWIGIDITYSAIAAIQERFKRARQDIWDKISIENRPTTMQQVEDRFLNGKQSLSARKEFEKFCVTTIGGLPNETMGADGGIDGRIRLQESKRALVSVKSGRVDVRQVRELKGLLGEKDIAGVFITKQKPTTPMIEFANQAGICKMKGDGLFSIDPFPKMQILTLEQILNGKTPNIPYAA